MAARVQVVAGPAGSGKTDALLQVYRSALARGLPGSTLWISPNHRAAAEVRQRLLSAELPGCFRPGIVTFEQFAEAVLQASARPVRPLSRLMKRQFLAHLVDAANERGELDYLRPLAGKPGLLDALGDFIAELKRLEIWPEDLAGAGKQRNALPKDREMAALYAAYQDALIRHELYDAEGRFWSARELLRSGQLAPFEKLRTVVVDGFADFTHTQFEILELLAERVEQLLISLPLEQERGRDDLFAKPRQTLGELTRRFSGLSITWRERSAPPAWPALDHVERHLFGDGALSDPPPADGIEVLGAAQALGEIELLGRRIKRLLSEGDGGRPVRPSDIAVVFRSTADAAPLVREIFGELGIPFALDARRTLLDCRAVAALLAILRLEVEQWPFRQVIAVVEQTYFQPDWPEWSGGQARAAVDETVRELQVSSGRQELLDSVRRWAERVTRDLPEASSEDDPRAKRRAKRSARAKLALPLLERLAKLLGGLPTSATLADWGTALGKLASNTGLRAVAGTPLVEGEAGQPEVDALDRLIECLKTADRLYEWMGQPAPQLDRAEALARIEDLVEHEPWPSDRDETGRVRVLSALDARGIRAPYLFVAGLAESAFPAGERANALFGRQDHDRLSTVGLPLPSWGARSQDEMLLFYETVTRGTRRLTLSYPTVDERAQPLVPSPYLDDLRRLFGAGLPGVAEVDLRPAALQGEPAGPTDLRLQAVQRALDDAPRLLAALRQEAPPARPSAVRSNRPPRTAPAAGQRALFEFDAADSPVSTAVTNPQLFGNLLAGLRMLGERQSREQFGPHEGLLLSPQALDALGQTFSDSYCWSPSALEHYRACPFKFFLQHVLEVDSPADLELQEDYGLRGNLLHAVLAELHRSINARAGRPTSPCSLSPKDFNELFERSLAEVWNDRPAASPLEAAWRVIDEDLVRRWGAEYLEQHRKYDAGHGPRGRAPRPERFELSFGPSRHQAGADPTSVATPLVLRRADGVVRLAGRIDRVDVLDDAGQTLFAVVDYKSGGSKRILGEMKNEVALQLPLYALAVEQLFFPDGAAEPAMAAYWFVKETGCQPKATLRFDGDRSADEAPSSKGAVAVDWAELRQQTIDQVFARVQGVRQGQFPIVSADDKCTSLCEYRTVCRVNHVRALDKPWQFPELPPV